MKKLIKYFSNTATENSKKNRKIMHQACAEGNLETVLHLIKHGNSRLITELIKQGQYAFNHPFSCLRQSDENGRSPLWVACFKGNLPIVKILYEHGAEEDVTQPDDQGTTPLWAASEAQHLDIIRFLYEHGGKKDVRRPNNSGVTPLSIACEFHKQLDVIRFLYEHGAKEDVGRADESGGTPLFYACQNNHLNTVQFLCKRVPKEVVTRPNLNGLTPLHKACFSGHFRIVRFLYQHCAKEDIRRPDGNGGTPFWTSCAQNYVHIARFLYEHGADEDAGQPCHGMTPLWYACHEGNLQIVQLLSSIGHAASENVNEPGLEQKTPMQIACKRDHADVVQFLIEQGTPSADVGSWYPHLTNVHMKMLLKRANENRDVDHESFLAFVCLLLNDEQGEAKAKAARVELINLKTTSMNGRRGTRMAWFPNRRRFQVLLEDGSKKVLVKSENVLDLLSPLLASRDVLSHSTALHRIRDYVCGRPATRLIWHRIVQHVTSEIKIIADLFPSQFKSIYGN